MTLVCCIWSIFLWGFFCCGDGLRCQAAAWMSPEYYKVFCLTRMSHMPRCEGQCTGISCWLYEQVGRWEAQRRHLLWKTCCCGWQPVNRLEDIGRDKMWKGGMAVLFLQMLCANCKQLSSHRAVFVFWGEEHVGCAVLYLRSTPFLAIAYEEWCWLVAWTYGIGISKKVAKRAQPDERRQLWWWWSGW